VAFGGSGPVHAGDVARALDIRRVLVPVSPGVFTAVGMLASDVEHHFVRAAGGALDDLVLERANARLDEMTGEALATLAQEGYPRDQVRLDCQADLRYVGQSSEPWSDPRRPITATACLRCGGVRASTRQRTATRPARP
jgi:N-methylhydantoinase A